MHVRTLLVAFLISSTALADPPVQANPPGDDVITVVKKGEAAPYTGQLFDQPTALRWANWLQQYRLRLDLDVRREKDLCLQQVQYEVTLRDSERDRGRKVESDLMLRLERSEKARLHAEEEARNPPWYRAPLFNIGLGFVGAASLVGLSAWVIHTAK